MKVLIAIEAVNYLDELIEILYRKEYFGFIETSIYRFLQNIAQSCETCWLQKIDIYKESLRDGIY
jgi:hypothetical protein